MKFGFLGFAHGHAHGYAHRLNTLPGAELVAISDHDATRLHDAVSQYGGAACTDYEILLARDDVDAVIVMAETSRHRELVIAAAEAGKHVLCEKPIATTKADGEAMVAACREHGVTFSTAFPMRFHPATIGLRQAIRDGGIGTPLAVNATNQGTMPPGWFQDPELAGGGAVMDHVVHVADLLRWIFDAEITEVYAEIDTRLTLGIPVDDVGILMLRLSNGITASLDSSWSRAKNWPTWGGVTLDVIGDAGVLAVDAFREHLQLVEDRGPSHVFVPWGEDPDLSLLQAFIAAARERKDPPVTGEDGLRALEVARCAYESAQRQAPSPALIASCEAHRTGAIHHVGAHRRMPRLEYIPGRIEPRANQNTRPFGAGSTAVRPYEPPFWKDRTLIEEGLVGHWPLQNDTNNHSPVELVAIAHDVEIGQADGRTGARFNGASSRLTVSPHPALAFGTDDFTFAAWVHTDRASDAIGDIAGTYAPPGRQGFNLAIVTNGGVTSTSQSNYRNLHFGIDAGSAPSQWSDCGYPGNATLAFALAVHDGDLYAGTFEQAADGRGRLWRYGGGQNWIELGNPDGCNAVTSIASFDGSLYCGTGRYNPLGSALNAARNRTPGGKVYRISPDGDWIYCGHPGADGATPDDQEVPGYYTGKADEVVALTVFRHQLYCGSYHRPGVFRYEGGGSWASIGLEDKFLMTLAVYHDTLFALLDGGSIYRYAGGSDWIDCGCPAGSEQTYGAVIAGGKMYVGTWPEADVFRFEPPDMWHRFGRVGYEREVMGMAHYNGKVYLGSLPMANVWRMDDDGFAFLGTLDQSPAPLRRAWALAVFDGRLFVSTLPSGRIHAMSAGTMVTWDVAFPAGWQHIVAVRSGGTLSLYLNGQRVARSERADAAGYDLTTGGPLTIGNGSFSPFAGLLSDARAYRRALDDADIGRLGAGGSAI